jgi:hypothetical protein
VPGRGFARYDEVPPASVTTVSSLAERKVAVIPGNDRGLMRWDPMRIRHGETRW